MSFLEKFDDWPSAKLTKILLIIGVILMILGQVLMNIFLAQSGDTTNMFASQLSFSGSFLKGQYSPMVITGGLSAYRTAMIIDYPFMVGYGLLIFAILLVVGRLFGSSEQLGKIAYIFAVLGLVAAGLDAIENMFILMTLGNPLFFPDSWAVMHSIFALPKWILIFASMIFAIVAFIKSKR